MTTSDTCPHCGTNLVGEPIPEGDRWRFPGNVTHYTRMIQVAGWRGTTWNCPNPDCGRQIKP